MTRAESLQRSTAEAGQADAPDRVRQTAVPSAARALSQLPRIDYEDAFLVDVGPAEERTAEQWSRAVLEDAPVTVRRTLQAGWSAIGLKLGGVPPERFVLGWEIRGSTPELVLLAADSRIGMAAELLFKRHQGTLLFATFVQKGNRIARALWAGVELVHVPVVRQVLDQASRRCRPGVHIEGATQAPSRPMPRVTAPTLTERPPRGTR